MFCCVIILLCIIFWSYLLFLLLHSKDIYYKPILFFPNKTQEKEIVKSVNKNDILCRNNNYYILCNRLSKIYIICNDYETDFSKLEKYNFEIFRTEKDLCDFENILFTYDKIRNIANEEDIIFVIKDKQKIFNVITSYYHCDRAFYNDNLTVIGVKAKFFKRVFYLPMSCVFKNNYEIKSRLRQLSKVKIMNW